MAVVPEWAKQALAEVYDPCCAEKKLSVIDLGLLRSVTVDGDTARVELLLTTGWCPFAARVIGDIRERIAAVPGISHAEVDVVWDEPWTTDRLSERARSTLRFLPEPAAVGDRDAYLAAHRPVLRMDRP